jgi:amino acid adenylation domain-containing protein
MFAETVAATPNAVAVVDGDRHLSYVELDALSTGIAARVAAAGIQRGDRVGLMVERGLPAILGILGILKAGGCYVPLDPHYPRERLRLLVDDSSPQLLLWDGSGDPPTGIRRIEIGFDRVTDPDSFRGWETVRRHDPAYVIYTSGSTGRPKGVVVTHSNVVTMLRAAETLFDFRADDRWTLFHSHSFDFSVWELWMPFAVGAGVVTVPATVAAASDEFLRLLGDQKITILNQVPSVFRFLADAAADTDRVDLALRYVIFGGEAIDPEGIQRFQEAMPTVAPGWINMYGITETTVHATFKQLGPADLQASGATPIGQPLPHLSIHLLDERGNEVAVGETGEIWVSGSGLAKGYLNRPELTAERFVDLGVSGRRVRSYRTGDLARRRDDGELEYLGRSDDQVKLRGFRIELGEIDYALSRSVGVREAATVVINGPAGPLLVALAACDSVDEPPSSGAMRDYLADHLPPHMLPNRILVVDSLPLAPSGKLDRRATRDLALRLALESNATAARP